MKKLLQDTSGLTLLELLVAVSLFTIVMVISTSMFLGAVDTQSRSVSSKTLQESLGYAASFMTAETTGALKDPTICNGSCVSADDFFCSLAGDTQLVFRNAEGVCILYEIEEDNSIPRLKVTRDPFDGASVSDYLTPSSVRLTDLAFNAGSANDGVDYIGSLTFALTGENASRAPYSDSLKLQTSIAVGPAN